MRGSKKVLLASWIVLGVMTLGGATYAQDQDRDRIQDRTQTPDQDRTRDQLQDRDQTPDQDRTRDRLNDGTGGTGTASGGAAGPAQTQYGPKNVYGWQLMTAQERAAYQSQMHAAATQEERDRIQAQHRSEMQQRARQRNVVLPGMSGTPRAMQSGGMGGRGPGGRH